MRTVRIQTNTAEMFIMPLTTIIDFTFLLYGGFIRDVLVGVYRLWTVSSEMRAVSILATITIVLSVTLSAIVHPTPFRCEDIV
jgi:hypothetical protein